ncbi:MAG: Epoxyqueuosine reductase [Phycisphaerae bacterium]|nr:Epoxyqueuosine reductase [Phycisphaerae bacterium]
MSPGNLNALVKRLAREAGFWRAGVTSAAPVGRADFLHNWLVAGHAGKMDYLARHAELRDDPRRLLDGARSVICLAADYRDAGPDDREPCPAGMGYVARYARGRDYHDVLRKRAWRLVDRLREELDEGKGDSDGSFDARVCVDTAPLLEREFAARAGLGWIGKNTMLIDPASGSYCFLAEIVTTLQIAPDRPIEDHCGRCRRCLDACPTAAFPQSGVMDARRCISYLTIELRDEHLPSDLAGPIGSHLFGCDICQSVCPFNERFSEVTGDEQLVPPTAAARALLPLAEVAEWDRERRVEALRGSAAKRAKPEMWRRNALNAQANAKSPE